MSWRLAPTPANALLAYRCFPSVTVSIATLGQAVAGHGPAVSIIGVLVMWRFIMGVGIGGDYPLSSVITSEFAATRIRGRMMVAT
ncbi:Inorganic phosphate transporter PHO84 [Rhodotorula toruloides]|nr:Inorganic phosphate transporter PHO84 [Rhodotorula toruloides]